MKAEPNRAAGDGNGVVAGRDAMSGAQVRHWVLQEAVRRALPDIERGAGSGIARSLRLALGGVAELVDGSTATSAEVPAAVRAGRLVPLGGPCPGTCDSVVDVALGHGGIQLRLSRAEAAYLTAPGVSLVERLEGAVRSWLARGSSFAGPARLAGPFVVLGHLESDLLAAVERHAAAHGLGVAEAVEVMVGQAAGCGGRHGC